MKTYKKTLVVWTRVHWKKGWSVDPMDAAIVMSPEYDVDDVECNVEAGYRFWRWLSRLCGSGNTNPGSVFVDRSREKRKAVTFTLEWTDEIESALCLRCRAHMQHHYHGELCRRCGAKFTINRPWTWSKSNFHHGLAHGTSSPVLKKRLTRSESA